MYIYICFIHICSYYVYMYMYMYMCVYIYIHTHRYEAEDDDGNSFWYNEKTNKSSKTDPTKKVTM